MNNYKILNEGYKDNNVNIITIKNNQIDEKSTGIGVAEYSNLYPIDYKVNANDVIFKSENDYMYPGKLSITLNDKQCIGSDFFIRVNRTDSGRHIGDFEIINQNAIIENLDLFSFYDVSLIDRNKKIEYIIHSKLQPANIDFDINKFELSSKVYEIPLTFYEKYNLDRNKNYNFVFITGNEYAEQIGFTINDSTEIYNYSKSVKLANDIDNLTSFISISGISNVYPGNILFLDGEIIRVDNIIKPGYITCTRGMFDTTSKSHKKDNIIFILNEPNIIEHSAIYSIKCKYGVNINMDYETISNPQYEYRFKKPYLASNVYVNNNMNEEVKVFGSVDSTIKVQISSNDINNLGGNLENTIDPLFDDVELLLKSQYDLSTFKNNIVDVSKNNCTVSYNKNDIVGIDSVIKNNANIYALNGRATTEINPLLLDDFTIDVRLSPLPFNRTQHSRIMCLGPNSTNGSLFIELGSGNGIHTLVVECHINNSYKIISWNDNVFKLSDFSLVTIMRKEGKIYTFFDGKLLNVYNDSLNLISPNVYLFGNNSGGELANAVYSDIRIVRKAVYPITDFDISLSLPTHINYFDYYDNFELYIRSPIETISSSLPITKITDYSKYNRSIVNVNNSLATTVPINKKSLINVVPSGNRFNVTLKNTLGLSDFTLETWISPNVVGSADAWGRILMNGINEINGSMYLIRENNIRPLRLRLDIYFNGYLNIIPAVNIDFKDNEWNHVAIVRKDGVFMLFVNGVFSGENSSYKTFNLTQQYLYIGSNDSGTEKFNARYSDIRLTRAIRYTKEKKYIIDKNFSDLKYNNSNTYEYKLLDNENTLINTGIIIPNYINLLDVSSLIEGPNTLEITTKDNNLKSYYNISKKINMDRSISFDRWIR